MISTMKLRKLFVASLLICAAGANTLLAQAREPIASLGSRYRTARTLAKAEGEMQRKFEALEAEIDKTMKLGRSSELRRLYTKGLALAAGKEWTESSDFAASLVLRADQVFVDSSQPFNLRLEQTYSPAIELTSLLTVSVSCYEAKWLPTSLQIGNKLRDSATFDNVNRDLLDEPFQFVLNLSEIKDGLIAIRADVRDVNRSLGTVSLLVDVRRGLNERLRKLESDWARVKGFESLHAEVLYPLDYVRNANRGRFPIWGFDVGQELSIAEKVLAEAAAGKDSFAQRIGDFKRHYLFEEANEIMPYRLYVPSTYKAERSYPLVIALHGNGGTENDFFELLHGEIQRLAEEHGYLVAAPRGYRVSGGYGNQSRVIRLEDRQTLELSEKDVMKVLDLMKRNYRIDESRIYLIGHSMGGSGTWYLGQRYPQLWAALGIIAGRGLPEWLPRIKHIPPFIVHGDADPTVSVEFSRTMVTEMKRLGMEYRYIEVPGGNHANIAEPNFRAMFEFFDSHRKAPVK